MRKQSQELVQARQGLGLSLSLVYVTFFPHYQAVLQFTVDVDCVAHSHLRSDTACPPGDGVRPD